MAPAFRTGWQALFTAMSEMLPLAFTLMSSIGLRGTAISLLEKKLIFVDQIALNEICSLRCLLVGHLLHALF